jgi:alpha-L-arabinofuranosidase
MKRIFLPLFLTVTLAVGLGNAQTDQNEAVIDATSINQKISRFIYSQFSEHLGNCIYDGMWVGENSSIPNENGIRTDVMESLRKIQVPSMRWPGGCFADEYHWMDGIGLKDKRPKMINTNWGGVTEDNSFGTHEFMELCRQLGCEPYISGNLGSGTVQEMSQWVEYLNSDNESPMTGLRKANGREKSWGVKFWGVGNESWGCGGRMKPDYYSDLALHYSTFLKNYGDNRLNLIAVGPNGEDYNWTDVVMKNLRGDFWGLSLHYYTWMTGTSATDFKEDGWFEVMKKTSKMEEIVSKHSAIMDKYDPAKNVALVVDEWGTWYDVEPGTNPGFLFQQNSLRDALVAGINLNIFNNHCDRVKMAAIAQVVNVLQAMVLTKGEKMLLTPTYHVFDMYKVHQDAYLVPSSLHCSNYTYDGESVPALSMSSSIDKNGKMHISICNLHATKTENLTCQLKGYKASAVRGQIVSADRLNAYNSFDKPNELVIHDFTACKLGKGQLEIEMPPHSVVTLELDGEMLTTDESVKLKNPVQGLTYKMYEGSWDKVPDFSTMQPVKAGTVTDISFPEGNKGSNFGLVYNGFVKIGKTGMYRFVLVSDDGSKLSIDGKNIVSNDGFHGMIEREGLVFLHEGYHPFKIEFFQGGGGSGLEVYIQDLKDGRQQQLTGNFLYHEKL